MLRITIHDETNRMTMELEGRVAGPWVEELDRAWHSVESQGNMKDLCIDIRNVTFVDAKGKDVLRRIYQGTGASFLANTPLTEMYVAEAKQQSAKNGKGETDDARS
jgi:hypothetical protein